MTALRYEARAGLDLRLLRAAVFTVATVALSAAGHRMASATAVPLWTLAAGFLAVFSVAAPLAGRARSLGGISALLAVGQVALHTLFEAGQQSTAMPHGQVDTSVMTHAVKLLYGSAGAAGMHAGHGHSMVAGHHEMPGGDMTAGPDLAMAQGAVEAAGTPGGAGGLAAVLHGLPVLPSLPMTLGHVLAAVATGWLLRRGELAVFRLVSLSVLSAQCVVEAALVRTLRGALALVRALRSGLVGARPAGPCPRRTSASESPPRTAALQHTVIRRGPPPVGACALAA